MIDFIFTHNTQTHADTHSSKCIQLQSMLSLLCYVAVIVVIAKLETEAINRKDLRFVVLGPFTRPRRSFSSGLPNAVAATATATLIKTNGKNKQQQQQKLKVN